MDGSQQVPKFSREAARGARTGLPQTHKNAAMAAKARRTSWAAPKQTLSLGPAFDKSWTETAVEYLTCSGGASPEEIKDLMKDARTPVTLHVYAVGHAKAIQEINYVVENFLHEGGVFHGARAASWGGGVPSMWLVSISR